MFCLSRAVALNCIAENHSLNLFLARLTPHDRVCSNDPTNSSNELLVTYTLHQLLVAATAAVRFAAAASAAAATRLSRHVYIIVIFVVVVL